MSSTAPSHRLILLRHAKSDWPVGVDDQQRPLAERGRRDAPAAGRWILDEIGVPDAIVTSPAVRTRQTVELVTRTWPWSPDIAVDDRIYEASVQDLQQVVQGLPDDASDVLLVGHNPGLEDFAAVWPDMADHEASRRLGEKFPTSAIAVIAVEGPWAAPSSRTLIRVEVPRG